MGVTEWQEHGVDLGGIQFRCDEKVGAGVWCTLRPSGDTG